MTQSGASNQPSEALDAPAPVGVEENFDAFGHLQANLSQPRSLRGFFRLVLVGLGLSRRASRRLSSLNAVLQLSGVAVLALQVLLSKIALERLFLETGKGNGDIKAVLPALIGLLAATGAGAVAASAQTQLQRMLSEKVQQSVVRSILDVTTAVPLEVFESPTFFDDLQRVRLNASLQPVNLSSALLQLIGGGIGAVVLVIALVTISPLLVPLLLIGALPQLLISRRTGSMEFGLMVRMTQNHRMREYLQDVLCEREEAKEIRAFNLNDVLYRRWGDAYDTYLDALRQHIRRRLTLSVLASFVTFVATGASLGILVWLVLHDRVSLAAAGAALIAIRFLAGRVELIFSGVTTLFETSLFLQDYEAFLTRKPDSHEGRKDVVEGAVRPFAALDVQHVQFRYPGSDRDVLHDVSMRIHAGEVVALVGENGSGKTTLAKLLAQVFSPTAGQVLWDGAATSSLSPTEMRRHIGVIFQDFVRYQLSARENIGFGRAEAVEDVDAIIDAAKSGGAHHFLSQLPQGYETPLGKSFYGGFDLSLGQWQRVAISRAFFRDASFLVLDEPTASLDAPSEHALFERMRELAAGRALLLISHRFSTVRSADRIYVLERGRITEEGAHDELMALNGRYAEMFNLQAASYR